MSAHSECIGRIARGLYARRAELAQELAEVDLNLDRYRRSYSEAVGYRVPLRPEAFKREVAS